MWGSSMVDATRKDLNSGVGEETRAAKLGSRRPALSRQRAPAYLGSPGLWRSYFPFALLLLAGFTLQPGLGIAAHEARQKIAASSPVLGIGGCDRGNCAAGAGAWVFPRHAGVLLASAENRAGSSACVGKIGVRRQLSHVLRAGRRLDRGSTV